jgi:arginase
MFKILMSRRMEISLLEVPYDLGADGLGGARAAQSLARASAAALGIPVAQIARGMPFRDTGSAVLIVNRQLAQAVRDAVVSNTVPIVLAGSCDVSLGVIGGLEHDRCGIVWFDAHGDFNTPDTTVTGFFGGMPLAVVTGHCYANLWSQIGNSRPVAEDATLLVGARDLDQLERELLEKTRVSVCGCQGGHPAPVFKTMLANLAQKVTQVYLHFDLDVLDPEVAPGLDLPVPGGLSAEGALQAIRAIADVFKIRAAAIVTTFNPDDDPDGRTERTGLRLVEQLAGAQSLTPS